MVKYPASTKPALSGKKCILQTFFAENQRVQYSIVQKEETEDSIPEDGLSAQHAAFFHQQKQDILDAKQDALVHANQVDGFDMHASTIVPWLSATGIADHVKGLQKDQIRTAVALPPSDEQSPLQIILGETDKLLREAHSWCFDGPECMLTWPCRVVLGRFQSSQIELMGKTGAFAPKKDATTLKTYFHTAKRFLAYLDRVGASRHDHFDVEPGSGGAAPEEVIELTEEQLSSWTSVRRLARRSTTCDGEAIRTQLRDELLRSWILLVCHNVGARRYRSPLLSFCAMLSIRPSTSG